MSQLLREFVHQLILETRLESQASQGARIAFQILKSHKGRQRRYEFSINNFPVNMLIRKSKQLNDNIKISGMTTHNQMFLSVEIGQMFVPANYGEAYTKLVNVIRHELEHVDQHQKKKKSGEILKPTYDIENALSGDHQQMLNYLLDPSEMAAFVSEIYMNAKKTRRPFRSAFQDRIKTFSNLMFKAGVPPQDIYATLIKVSNAWGQYARKRYPILRKSSLR